MTEDDFTRKKAMLDSSVKNEITDCERRIASYYEAVAAGEADDEDLYWINFAIAGLAKKASLLELHCGPSEEVNALYDHLIKLCRVGTYAWTHLGWLNFAFVRKVVLACEQGQYERALVICDELIAELGDNFRAARALANKGRILENLNRPREAIAIYSDLIAKYAVSTSPQDKGLLKVIRAERALLRKTISRRLKRSDLKLFDFGVTSLARDTANLDPHSPPLYGIILPGMAGEAISLDEDLNDSVLTKWIAAKGVPTSKRRAVAKAIHRLVDMELRPKWDDRDQHDNLKRLTAPEFLKIVHAGSIKKNVVVKQDIRDFDESLMKAVEAYITNRNRRKLDLGDARGLKFVLKHPARNVNPSPKRRAAGLAS